MKKIINKKLYNTETAKKIGEIEYDVNDRLFYVIKTLYKKVTGEYFLHCEGGAGTPYAMPDGDGMMAGELITPLTYEAAEKWCEKNLNSGIYEKEFGVPEEGEHQLHLKISLAEKAKLEEYMRKNKLGSMSVAIRTIINKL